MVGNSILDQVIEQARQRNAQSQAAQQARMAAMPQSVAPIVNPILENLNGGGMESMAPNVTQTPQQAYNSAVAFQQSPMSYVSPVMSVMSDYSRNQAAQNPNVQVNVAQPYGAFGRAMGYQDAPKGVTSWAQNPAAAAVVPEINAAWSAKRAQFMNAEKQAEEDNAFAATFGGSYGGSVNGGPAAGSAGEFSAFDSAAFGDIGVGGISGFGDDGTAGDSGGDSAADSSGPF